jgi:hypothetical protein
MVWRSSADVARSGRTRRVHQRAVVVTLEHGGKPRIRRLRRAHGACRRRVRGNGDGERSRREHDAPSDGVEIDEDGELEFDRRRFAPPSST